MFPRHEGHMADMDGMDMGSSSSSSSSSNSSSSMMMSVFHVATDTALFSDAWTPSSQGRYAGTCIFVIALATIFRLLLAAKAFAEARWLDRELARRYVVVPGKPTLADNVAHDAASHKMTMTLSENGVEENVFVLEKRHGYGRPWRVSVDPLRAALDTVIAGVGYLLMIAVMSMNVGYFMSVLGGTFLGSLLVGRYTFSTEH